MEYPNTPTFKCFTRLPLELRLSVWESLLPPRRDLKIGPRISETNASELGLVWTNEPPLTLLSACRESRNVALENGCFTSNPTEDPGRLVWVDRRPTVVYLPLTTASYSRARSLPIELEALAYLWPSVEALRNLKQSLLDQPPTTPIRAIYIGLSVIAYNHPPEGVTYPDLSNLPPEQLPPNPLYEGSNILVMDLNDARLLALVECADGMGKGTPPTFNHDKDASCFLETIKLYWENDARASELREAWYDTMQIELKPAIIFGKTREALFFGRSSNKRLHELRTPIFHRRPSFD